MARARQTCKQIPRKERCPTIIGYEGDIGCWSVEICSLLDLLAQSNEPSRTFRAINRDSPSTKAKDRLTQPGYPSGSPLRSTLVIWDVSPVMSRLARAETRAWSYWREGRRGQRAVPCQRRSWHGFESSRAGRRGRLSTPAQWS